MARYRTRDGDMLDALCLAFYGHADGYLEAVLAANPGLANIGPVYSAGLMIELPDLPAQQQNHMSIRLWS